MKTHAWRAAIVAAGIVLGTAWLFWPVVNQTRSWDDAATIFQNPALNPPSFSALPRFWLRPHLDLYIPLTHTLWWVLAKLSIVYTPQGPQLGESVFHAANLVIHVLAALVAFSVLRRLVRNDIAACAGALLFAIHPLQVEPVAWISGMKDLLCGLLCLLALDQYIAAVTNTTNTKRNNWNYAASIIAFVAAMLSKPTAMMLPLILLAVDALALRRPNRAIIRDALPFVLLAIPCVLWTALAQPAPKVIGNLTWPQRFGVASDALSFYLKKLFAPTKLAVDYGRTPAVALAGSFFRIVWIVPVALAGLSFLFRRRAPLLVVAAILFIAPLLPVLGLRKFDFQSYSTVSDRYTYLSMLGAGGALAALLARFKPAAFAIAAILLIALFWRTHGQIGHWRSSESLFQHTLDVNPRSWWACNNLAGIALADKHYDAAETHARRALQLGGDYASVHMNLGMALQGRNQLAEATRQFERAVEIRPDMPECHMSLAGAYFQARRFDEAIEHVREAIRLNPLHPTAPRVLRQLIQLRDSSPPDRRTLDTRPPLP